MADDTVYPPMPDDDPIVHKISVAKLRELLLQLDDHYELYPNGVGNLAIGDSGAYIGFIDLLDPHQCVELFSERDKS